MKTNLTEEEFDLLLELSKNKALKIVERTRNIYDDLSINLNEKQKEILSGFLEFIINEREIYVDIELKKFLKIGMFVEDPYFHIALYCLTPFIYEQFILNNVTPSDIANVFRIRTINDNLDEKRPNTKKEYLRIFYDEFINFLVEMRNRNKELSNKWFSKAKGNEYMEKSMMSELILEYNDDEFRNYLKECYPIPYGGITKSFMIRILKKLRNYLRLKGEEIYCKKVGRKNVSEM
jgi:hypothetical protein